MAASSIFKVGWFAAREYSGENVTPDASGMIVLEEGGESIFKPRYTINMSIFKDGGDVPCFGRFSFGKDTATGKYQVKVKVVDSAGAAVTAAVDYSIILME